MNLQDLFEKDKVKDQVADKDNAEEQEIDIRDPRTKWLVNKARARYAYADTDLEAFVQFMRDEVDGEKEKIKTNIDDIDKEHDINVKQGQDIGKEHDINVKQGAKIKTAKEIQTKNVDDIEKEAELNAKQERHINYLEKKEKQMDVQMQKFDDLRKNIEQKLKKMDNATITATQ